MSLAAPPALLAAAERGPVDDAAFVDCVRESLPYAWRTVSRIVAVLDSAGGDFADNVVPPETETAARRARRCPLAGRRRSPDGVGSLTR